MLLSRGILWLFCLKQEKVRMFVYSRRRSLSLCLCGGCQRIQREIWNKVWVQDQNSYDLFFSLLSFKSTSRTTCLFKMKPRDPLYLHNPLTEHEIIQDSQAIDPTQSQSLSHKCMSDVKKKYRGLGPETFLPKNNRLNYIYTFKLYSRTCSSLQNISHI